MEKERKKKVVEEKYGPIKPYIKRINGKEKMYFRVSYNEDGVRKQPIAKTEEELIERLFKNIKTEDTNKLTVEDVFFRAHKARVESGILSPNTTRSDLVYWDEYFKDSELPKKRILTIGSTDIRRFCETLVGRGNIDKRQFNKAKSVLNFIFDYAQEEGIVNYNPSRNFHGKRLHYKLPKSSIDQVYSSEERETILNYVTTLPQDVYALAIRLAFCFCLRIGELRALTWDDYYEERRLIRIWHQIVREPKNGKERCDEDVPYTKSALASGERFVQVSDEAAGILSELRKLNGEKKYILNGSRNAQFSIACDHFNQFLKKICEEAGVRYLSSHKIRFYGITELYDAGVEERTIQYIAGHKDPKMTRRYDRSQKIKKMDASVLESVFGGTKK